MLTGASNGLNQIWERDLDRLMDRTKDRPIPAGRMTINQALVYSIIAGVLGISILWLLINPLSGSSSQKIFVPYLEVLPAWLII